MPKALSAAFLRLPLDPGHDGHVHTRLCNHASGEMEDYVLAAIDAGLHSLCFLEHLEIGIEYSHRIWLRPMDFDSYFLEGFRLRKCYGDRIKLLLGVEAGINQERIPELCQSIAAYPFDRVGLSCHFLRHGNRHLNLLSSRAENIRILQKLNTDELLERYLKTLLIAVLELPGNVVCHIDAALRYVKGVCLREHHFDILKQIFSEMAARDMSLEINTSGLPIRKECFPAAPVIALSKRYNLSLIAGSDAHCPEHVGRFFDIF